MYHSDPKKKKKAQPVSVPPTKGKEIVGNSSPNSKSPEVDTTTPEQHDELIPKSVQQDHGGAKRIVNPGPEGDL